MTKEVWQRLRAMGDEFNLGTIQATQQLFAPLALAAQQAGANCVRDLRYGEHERHRLDIFHAPAARNLPVVVFVHGGGFAAGDKGDAHRPFYGNVGAWAVRCGFIGVVMTYRLAPDHAWPAGAQDVGAALRWLQANIGRYGGDAACIVPVGQSAGAAHVAGCLAGHGMTAGQVPTVAGTALLSGIFEPDAFHVNPMHTVYFGTDRATYSSRSAVLALAAASVPCLFTISEFDPPQFHRQLAAVFAAHTAMRGRCPEVLHLQGHNHVSSSLQLGSTIDTLGPSLCAFVRRVCGQPMH
jgi:acetyl esterase/lipase